MDFDIRTILVAMHAVVWINFSLMIIAWYNTKSLRNTIRYWFSAQALYGIGTLLVALRGIIPDVLSVITANAALVGAQIAVQEGIAMFMARAGYLRKFSFSVFAVHMLLILFFTYTFSSITIRIVIYGLSISLISVISIKTLYQKNDELGMLRTFLAAILVFIIIILTIRSGFAVLAGNYTDLMHAGLIQAIAIIGMLLAYVSLSIALFWLVVHKLGQKIRLQATTDSLTKVSNRRALDELMESQVPLRTHISIGIMMIDVDHFKKINDKFGHQAGDLYLIELAKMVQEEDNNLFRYAGDEFVVIAYDLDIVALEKRAEALREKVEKMFVSWWEEGQISTTVSIGIAIADYNTKNWDELIKKADTALYNIKKKGGNNVGVNLGI